MDLLNAVDPIEGMTSKYSRVSVCVCVGGVRCVCGRCEVCVWVVFVGCVCVLHTFYCIVTSYMKVTVFPTTAYQLIKYLTINHTYTLDEMCWSIQKLIACSSDTN